jgi:hypothetical protein
MYYTGDKYGDNKHDYKLGPVSRVSIVHYNAFVARKDRVEMTPTVCFEFCRTVPNMGFFGITNGRSCYCTPYFEAMASDSSQCDAVCEGDDKQTCGGKAKSSIFAMHMCASTSQDLDDGRMKAQDLASSMTDKITKATDLSKNIKMVANDLKDLFGFVGDSGATDLAQSTKIYAQSLVHMADDTRQVQEKLTRFWKQADSLLNAISQTQESSGSKTLPSDMMIEAEHLIDSIDAEVAAGEESSEKLDENIATVSPPKPYYETKKALPNYVPVMYFIDRKFDGIKDPKNEDTPGAPTTCTGDLVGTPIIGKSAEECAQACDDQLVNGCKAFQHFSDPIPREDGQMCFLFSAFKTGVYYTGCKAKTNMDTGCWAKFSKFAGGKFDGSGTLEPGGFGPGRSFCKECFKTFTKADRCYTAKIA